MTFYINERKEKQGRLILHLLTGCRAFYQCPKDKSNQWVTNGHLVELDETYQDGVENGTQFVTKFTHRVSDIYLNAARAMQHPEIVALLAKEILSEFRSSYPDRKVIDYVISISPTSAPLALEIARTYKARYFLLEDLSQGDIQQNAKVLLIEAFWTNATIPRLDKFFTLFSANSSIYRGSNDLSIHLEGILGVIDAASAYNIEFCTSQPRFISLASAYQNTWPQNDPRVKDYIDPVNRLAFAWKRDTMLWPSTLPSPVQLVQDYESYMK